MMSLYRASRLCTRGWTIGSPGHELRGLGYYQVGILEVEQLIQDRVGHLGVIGGEAQR